MNITEFVKQRWRSFIAAGILVSISFLLLCAYYPYQDTQIKIHAKINKSSTWRIYYDDTFGTHELKSRLFYMALSDKISLYSYMFNNKKLRSFMLRPMVETEIEIDKISVEHDGQIKSWQGSKALLELICFNACKNVKTIDDKLVMTINNGSTFIIKKQLTKYIHFRHQKGFNIIAVFILILGILTYSYYNTIRSFFIRSIIIRKLTAFFSDPKMIFLISAIVFGMLYVIFTPPFQGPDEQSHFFRAFALSEGKIVMDQEKTNKNAGAFLPKSLSIISFEKMSGINFHPHVKVSVSRIRELFDIELNPMERTFHDMGSIPMYSPFNYFAQSLGIGLGRLLFNKPIIYMYMGRMGNLLLWIIIICFSIVLAPTMKRTIVLIALMPTSLFTATTLSADALINSIAILMMAVILKIKSDEKIMLRDMMIFTIASLLLSTSKMVYFPLLGLALLIPVDKFTSKKNYFMFMFVFIVVNLAANFGWYMQIKNIVEYVQINPPDIVEQQKKLVLQQPFHVLKIVLLNLKQFHSEYLKTMIGSLGWGDVRMPDILYRFYPLFLLSSILIEYNRKLKIYIWEKLVFAGIIIAIVFLVMTSLIMVATGINCSVINCVHGRYFIPLAGICLMLFYNHWFHWKNTTYINIIYFIFMVLVQLTSLKYLILRYYNF